MFDSGNSWDNILKEEKQKPYFQDLVSFLESENASGEEIYPPHEEVFNAFKQTPYEEVKVIILGQDPYHGPNQAHGLCFSVKEGVIIPPSLKNIYKELSDDVGFHLPNHGNLISWARQGVMLLNTTLTVRRGKPMSHYGKGWEKFTDTVITKLAEREDPLVFVLWGNSAKLKCEHILNSRNSAQHLILSSPHPSPFSARTGFFGSRHFSKINIFLEKRGKKPINWTIS